MKVKGTAVATLPIFVKETFGEDGFQRWYQTLSPEAQAVFIKPVLNSWYPLTQTLTEPTKKICDMFYGGRLDGAWGSGRFSASQGLKGIYKMFIKLGSASFFIKKAATILPTYYQPSELKVIESSSSMAMVHITQFPEADEIIDHRIGGWIECALELSGCKNVRVTIGKSLSNGDPYTEIQGDWD